MDQGTEQERPKRFWEFISWKGCARFVIEGLAAKQSPALGAAVNASRVLESGDRPGSTQQIPVGDVAKQQQLPLTTRESTSGGRSDENRVATRDSDDRALNQAGGAPVFTTGVPSVSSGRPSAEVCRVWQRTATSLSVGVQDGHDIRVALEGWGFHRADTQAFDVLSFQSEEFLSDGETLLLTRGFFEDQLERVVRAREGFPLVPQSAHEVSSFYDAMDRRKNEAPVIAVSPAVKDQPSDAEYVTLIDEDGLMSVVNGYTLLSVLSMSTDAEGLRLYQHNSNLPAAVNPGPYTRSPVVVRDMTQSIYDPEGALWCTVAVLTPKDMSKAT